MGVVPEREWSSQLPVLELLAGLKVEGLRDPGSLDWAEDIGVEFDAVAIGAEGSIGLRDVDEFPGRLQPLERQRPTVPGIKFLCRYGHRRAECKGCIGHESPAGTGDRTLI